MWIWVTEWYLTIWWSLCRAFFHCQIVLDTTQVTEETDSRDTMHCKNDQYHTESTQDPLVGPPHQQWRFWLSPKHGRKTALWTAMLILDLQTESEAHCWDKYATYAHISVSESSDHQSRSWFYWWSSKGTCMAPSRLEISESKILTFDPTLLKQISCICIGKHGSTLGFSIMCCCPCDVVENMRSILDPLWHTGKLAPSQPKM